MLDHELSESIPSSSSINAQPLPLMGEELKARPVKPLPWSQSVELVVTVFSVPALIPFLLLSNICGRKQKEHARCGRADGPTHSGMALAG